MNLSGNAQLNIDMIKKLSEQNFLDYPILAQLEAAQAILESNLQGQPSELAIKYNNLFGIKGQGTHNPSRAPLLTHEYENGEWLTVTAGFAWNNDLEDSLKQHRHLLENGTLDKPNRYKNIFQNHLTFLDIATMIRLDGYATDPNYTIMLIDIYNRWIKD